VALEVFLRPHGEAQTTFSITALLLERAQCGLTFLSRLPCSFELLLERRELVLGLVGSDGRIVPQFRRVVTRKWLGDAALPASDPRARRKKPGGFPLLP
jgi:hypothetical protein